MVFKDPLDFRLEFFFQILYCVFVLLMLFVKAELDRSRETDCGASQIKGFSPLLEETFPSIYRIFRAYQNTNRWRIIDTMFGKSQPLDARVMFFR